MLAYVFWHWPAAGVESSVYDAALRRFHDALAALAPAGFVSAAAFRVHPAPFGGAGDRPYEDWYLLTDSAALDALDAAAVGTACGEAHAEVAALAAGGTAGLYRLLIGPGDLGDGGTATWFDVPPGAARPSLVETATTAATGVGGSLWMRRMTLGPAPELCVMAGDVELGIGQDVLHQERVRVSGRD